MNRPPFRTRLHESSRETRHARVLLRALGGGRTRLVPGRAHVRDLFLRVLGAIAAIAFLSLTLQVRVLFGAKGLLPAGAFLDSARPFVGFARLPTLFWLDASDGTLVAAGVAGTAASLLLAAGMAPRACLVAIWALYLSFVSIGQSFLAFQWDTLLLESVAVALAVAPAGLRPRRAPSPAPLGVFLVLWLAFRLHFESGVTKLVSGDPTWRDLTAMSSYYETAPLPTPLGWYAHQLPIQLHMLTSAAVLALEIGIPFLFWAPWRRLRAALFSTVCALQAGIFLTANYGFFNPLSAALALFLLDDGHLAWLAAKVRVKLAPRPLVRARRSRTAALLAVTVVAVGLTLLAFFERLGLEVPAGPLRSLATAVAPFRTVNAYALFTRMTLVRKEVVIEGSEDGEHWQSYEFRYEPGDVDRAPPFVAPHQPRVDFLCWFLLLGSHDDAFFQTLVKRLGTEPATVASLFARMPFGAEKPPRWLRVSTWRYRFSDAATRARTGAWWTRDAIGTSNAIDTSEFPRAGR